MIIEERPPTWTRWFEAADHVLRDRGLGEVDAELEQLAVNPWSAPQRIGTGYPANQISDLGAAQQCLERALELAREAEDRKIEVRSIGSLGNVFWRQGRNEEALAHFQEILALSREIGDRRGEASAIGSLGLVLSTQGHHDKALVQIEKALALLREMVEFSPSRQASIHTYAPG